MHIFYGNFSLAYEKVINSAFYSVFTLQLGKFIILNQYVYLMVYLSIFLYFFVYLFGPALFYCVMFYYIFKIEIIKSSAKKYEKKLILGFKINLN